jgi:hypothetical protein
MTPEQFGRTVVEHLQGWMRALQEADAAVDRRRDETIDRGLRLVSGGQISGWIDGRTLVEYTDNTTGELLFSGEVADPAEGWHDAWFHVDRLTDDLPLPDHPVDPSLPAPVRDFLATVSEKCLDLESDGLRALLGEVTR